MEEKGLYSTQFVTIHKSFRVNKKYISKYDSKSASVELKVYDKDYMTKTIKLAVSENYQNVIKKLLS